MRSALLPLVLWSCNALTGANDLSVAGESPAAPEGDDDGGDDDDDRVPGGGGEAGVRGEGGDGNAGEAGGAAGNPGAGAGAAGAGGEPPPVCGEVAACVLCCTEGASAANEDELGRRFLRECFCDPLDSRVAPSVSCEDASPDCRACCETFCEGGGGDDTAVAECLRCAENGGSGAPFCVNLGVFCFATGGVACDELQSCVEDQCRNLAARARRRPSVALTPGGPRRVAYPATDVSGGGSSCPAGVEVTWGAASRGPRR